MAFEATALLIGLRFFWCQVSPIDQFTYIYDHKIGIDKVDTKRDGVVPTCNLSEKIFNLDSVFLRGSSDAYQDDYFGDLKKLNLFNSQRCCRELISILYRVVSAPIMPAIQPFMLGHNGSNPNFFFR